MDNYICFCRIKKIICFLLSIFIVYLFISYYIFGIESVLLFSPIAFGVYYNILQSNSKKEFFFGTGFVCVYASAIILLTNFYFSIQSIYFKTTYPYEEYSLMFGKNLLISSILFTIFFFVIINVKLKFIKYRNDLFPKSTFMFSRLLTLLFCLFFILPFLTLCFITSAVLFYTILNNDFNSIFNIDFEIFVFLQLILFVFFGLSNILQLALNLKYSKNIKENVIGLFLFVFYAILLNLLFFYICRIENYIIKNIYSNLYEKYFYHLIFLNLSPLLLGLLLRYLVKYLENKKRQNSQ